MSNLLKSTSTPSLILNIFADDEIEDLKYHLPHVHLNPTSLKIATSYQFFEPQDGFWEIVVKQLELFDKELDSNSENSETKIANKTDEHISNHEIK